MAIDTTDSYQEFTADGHTAYFSFNFNYVDASEIVVGKRTGDNTYEIVRPEYYQVIPNAATNGGQVRFISNPSGSEIVDNPVPAGTIVRIERRSPETSNATWQIGLEMSDLVVLFDTLFRLVQENTGRFDNTIETFATQHGVKLYELLEEHTDKLLYWDNDTKTITPTDFPRQDVVRSVGGLFFRIKVDNSTNTPYLEWSQNGVDGWYGINIDAVANQATETLEKAEQGIADAAQAQKTANAALEVTAQLEASKANKTDVYNKQEADEKFAGKTEIDELASLHHVRDIINTRAELRTYPTAANHIVKGDILIVRNTTGDIDISYDEAEHLDGEATCWRFNGGVWEYAGAIGYEAFNKIRERLNKIEEVIPDAASTTNQLADKAFVNSSVQTATANFRGNWATWADVPTSTAAYPVDYAGSKIPTVNDYLVVANASDYQGQTLVGTWRFKYSGTWATDGKNGWLPEYQVNEEPLTMAQLAALNSGVSAKLLEDMQADIDRVDGKTAELDGDLQGKVDKAQGAANVGKFLKVGADGNVVLGDVDSGVTEVAHDDTLTGKGTTAEPLSVVKPSIIIRRW